MSNVRSAEKARVSTCAAADAIASTIIDQYNRLTKRESDSYSQIVLAGIVAITNSETLQVLSLGIGNKFHPQGIKSESVPRDSHAEVLARRAFKRIILEEYIAITQKNEASDLFEVATNKNIISLRKNIQLVLYVSSAPCGNACIRRWGDSPKESTRSCSRPLEIFNDYPHPPFQAHSIHEGQAAVSFKGESGIFSCSDKILRWNVLGLQGARLSAIVERINLSGIVIGRKFVRKHAQRAFCCRLNWKKVDKEIRETIHHPSLMCTAVKLDNGVFDTDSENGAVFSDFSMWWNLRAQNTEIFSLSPLSRKSFNELHQVARVSTVSGMDELKRKLDAEIAKLNIS